MKCASSVLDSSAELTLAMVQQPVLCLPCLVAMLPAVGVADMLGTPAVHAALHVRRLASMPLHLQPQSSMFAHIHCGINVVLYVCCNDQTAALQQSFICSGFEVDCLDSVRRLFMPTAAALVADLREAIDAFLIKSWPSEHPDVDTMVKKSDMGKPGFVAPIRTQPAMVELSTSLISQAVSQ